MSRLLSEKYSSLVPYTPGEQPQDKKYIKLNTNESPFPPSSKAVEMAREEAERLYLYPDPTYSRLCGKMAELLGLDKSEIVFSNGSDEILNYAFMAYCDAEHPAVFPDITYGFYSVLADINNIPYETIPLCEDFTIRVEDYCGLNKTIFLANPNAPTGIPLFVSEIETIVRSNPNSVVVVDEAYVDFGGESCIPLIRKYDNLMVTQTFSKSRSMAGARLGFGAACPALIADINAIRFSTNPYNVNRMTMAAGLGVLEDEEYTRANCRAIIANREWTCAELEKLGFSTLPSGTNFVFTTCPAIPGGKLYETLKERGILVRHFGAERIKDYIRVTIGSREQMEAFIEELKKIV